MAPGAILEPAASALAARRGRRPRRAPASGSSYYLLLAVVGMLLAIGLVMVLSSSSVMAFAKTGDSYVYFRKQATWALAGVAVMLAVSRVDYRRWRRLGAPLLVLSAGMLVFVLVHPSAVSAYGSTRWISVGRLTFQPAEFAKLSLLLFSADVLVRKERLLGDVRHLLVPVLPVMLALALLVLAEPDLGTTMLLCAIAFSMLFLAGAPVPLLGGLGLLGLGAAFATLRGYQRARLASFLDPGSDYQAAGYQLIQGHLALGSGGLLGVGLGQSYAKWSFLPNAHTDFIFAIIGEELGLLGSLTVIALFVTLAYAGVRVARRAHDAFGRYLAGGITVWIMVQALVNIGAVVGVLPITGVPLPLVSSGGSSMLVLLAAVGMLLNVARQEAWRSRAAVVARPAPARPVRSRRGPGAGTPRRAPAGGRLPDGGRAARPSPSPAPARQTPAQKARADAARAPARPRPTPKPARERPLHPPEDSRRRYRHDP
jgi:cell division protein FtsW